MSKPFIEWLKTVIPCLVRILPAFLPGESTKTDFILVGCPAAHGPSLPGLFGKFLRRLFIGGTALTGGCLYGLWL